MNLPHGQFCTSLTPGQEYASAHRSAAAVCPPSDDAAAGVGLAPPDGRAVKLTKAGRPDRRAERMRKLHADPEFAKRHAERMRKLNADPTFRAKLGHDLPPMTPAQRKLYTKLRTAGIARPKPHSWRRYKNRFASKS